MTDGTMREGLHKSKHSNGHILFGHTEEKPRAGTSSLQLNKGMNAIKSRWDGLSSQINTVI